MSETAISARFQEAMDRLGVYCIRLQSGIVAKGARHIHLCRKGTPDRLVIRNGRTVFIEFKAPRGVLSPEQQREHARLRLAGATVLVETDSAEAVRHVFDATR